jgi:hypothetical protein
VLPNLVTLLKFDRDANRTYPSVRKNCVYSREHLPPHFHALYAEYEELIEIKTLDTYAGHLPARQHSMLIKWAGVLVFRAFC